VVPARQCPQCHIGSFLHDIGLLPDVVVFDDTITCAVNTNRWVDFRGQEHSLSSSALEIAHEKGFGWTAFAGDYWKYEGKTLSELRAEEDINPFETQGAS
jgi:hypothetical protein